MISVGLTCKNLSSFCSNRCDIQAKKWSADQMLQETKHSSAILCMLLAFMGLMLQVPTMMLKSTRTHSKCFVPLSCKHLQLHMANDNKTYQLENPICNPINPTSTNDRKLFLICCLPLFLVFHWPWLSIAKLRETSKLSSAVQEHIFVLACVFSVSSRSTSDFSSCQCHRILIDSLKNQM